ncbi:MAG: hypothetical protein ACRDMV_12150 [Streptosporangiales bacterium]
MTRLAESALVSIMVDLVVLLEIGADEGGLGPEACADSLERLYGVLDGLPDDGRHLVLRTVRALVADEAAGANRADRLDALRSLRQVLEQH